MKYSGKYSLKKAMLNERVIELGSSSVTLPRGILGTAELDLSDPQTTREKNAAKVLSVYRRGIETRKAAQFGNIGEGIAAAVLDGEQTNQWWDQNSLFSDIKKGETYYSVKGVGPTSTLTNQKITLYKIKMLLEQKGSESLSIGIFEITTAGDNDLLCKWSDPQTLTVESIAKISETESAGWAVIDRKVNAGMTMTTFRSLEGLGDGSNNVVNLNEKIIKLPAGALEAGDYELTPNELRASFRDIFNDFREADLTDEDKVEIGSHLGSIKNIVSSEQ